MLVPLGYDRPCARHTGVRNVPRWVQCGFIKTNRSVRVRSIHVVQARWTADTGRAGWSISRTMGASTGAVGNTACRVRCTRKDEPDGWIGCDARLEPRSRGPTRPVCHTRLETGGVFFWQADWIGSRCTWRPGSVRTVYRTTPHLHLAEVHADSLDAWAGHLRWIRRQTLSHQARRRPSVVPRSPRATVLPLRSPISDDEYNRGCRRWQCAYATSSNEELCATCSATLRLFCRTLDFRVSPWSAHLRTEKLSFETKLTFIVVSILFDNAMPFWKTPF